MPIPSFEKLHDPASNAEIRHHASIIMDWRVSNHVAQPIDKGVKLTPPGASEYDYAVIMVYLPAEAYRQVRCDVRNVVRTKAGGSLACLAAGASSRWAAVTILGLEGRFIKHTR